MTESGATKGQSPRECRTTVTMLAMDRPPAPPFPPAPLRKIAILRAENAPGHFYRYLYQTIGTPYYWVERYGWNDKAFSELFENENNVLYVLYVDGVPAGMAEIDFSRIYEAHLAYFGLVPEFIGQRIGPWFLLQAVELAWSRPIRKLTVTTRTLDHSRALATYQRVGFEVYGRVEQSVFVPADFPQAPKAS